MSLDLRNARPHDLARQFFNLLFALVQITLPPVGALLGVNSGFTRTDAAGTTLITPAGYAFAVWGLIYTASLAYAIYQALPAQRENPLFRRIGWYTAITFAATCVWLLAAQSGATWVTVGCIVVMLVTLTLALIELIRVQAPRDARERWLVVLPISVFLGWVTAATVANTSAALYESGFRDVLLSEVAWTLLMLTAAIGIGAFVTLVSRGNLFYAGTVVWFLVGLLVAALTRDNTPAVAVLAGAGVVIVAAAAFLGQRRRPRQQAQPLDRVSAA
jgi:hypothetical protein